jgi:hypothetical protein
MEQTIDLEMLSFIVIGLLAVSIGLVSFARAKTSGWLRRILIFVAFLMLIPSFLGMLIVILGIQ